MCSGRRVLDAGPDLSVGAVVFLHRTVINNWTGKYLSVGPATAHQSGGKATQETCPAK